MSFIDIIDGKPFSIYRCKEHGDLIKIEGSRDMELIPDEAARIGKELIRLARRGGWIDPEENDWK